MFRCEECLKKIHNIDMQVRKLDGVNLYLDVTCPICKTKRSVMIGIIEAHS